MDNVKDTISLILAGGMLGAGGHCVQFITTLIMTKDTFREVRFSRIARMLILGFGVGCLGVLFLIRSAASQLTAQNIVTLILLGYTIGDFAEKVGKSLWYKTGKDRQQIGEPG